MKKNIIFFLIILLSCSCAYKHKLKKLKTPVKVYIEYFKNSTNEPRLEDYFTEKLKLQFIKRKDTLVISQPENADLFIKGNILNFRYSGISFSSADRSLEFRAEMKVKVTLIDKNGVILKTKIFYEYKEFRTGLREVENIKIDVGINENLRSIIYKKISEIIAEDIYDWMFAGF